MFPRNMLFVPADEKKLKKSTGIPADAFIFDIEDSIKEEDKDDALDLLKRFLAEFYPEGRSVFIRINAQRWEKELTELKAVFSKIDGIMIPKAENPLEIKRIIDCIEDKKSILLIETPKGLVRLKELVEIDATWAIAFGAEDYTCETGMKNDENYLLPIKYEIVKYAKAYGKKCFDTISKELKDEEFMYSEAVHSKNIGFDGKLAIHPKQINAINNAYVKDCTALEKILEVYNNSETGVMVYEGKVYDRPHIEEIKKMLED